MDNGNPEQPEGADPPPVQPSLTGKTSTPIRRSKRLQSQPPDSPPIAERSEVVNDRITVRGMHRARTASPGLSPIQPTKGHSHNLRVSPDLTIQEEEEDGQQTLRLGVPAPGPDSGRPRLHFKSVSPDRRRDGMFGLDGAPRQDPKAHQLPGPPAAPHVTIRPRQRSQPPQPHGPSPLGQGGAPRAPGEAGFFQRSGLAAIFATVTLVDAWLLSLRRDGVRQPPQALVNRFAPLSARARGFMGPTVKWALRLLLLFLCATTVLYGASAIYSMLPAARSPAPAPSPVPVPVPIPSEAPKPVVVCPPTPSPPGDVKQDTAAWQKLKDMEALLREVQGRLAAQGHHEEVRLLREDLLKTQQRLDELQKAREAEKAKEQERAQEEAKEKEVSLGSRETEALRVAVAQSKSDVTAVRGDLDGLKTLVEELKQASTSPQPSTETKELLQRAVDASEMVKGQTGRLGVRVDELERRLEERLQQVGGMHDGPVQPSEDLTQLKATLDSVGVSLKTLTDRVNEVQDTIASLAQKVESPTADRIAGLDSKVESLVAAALDRYEADKTGLMDYALQSQGGVVVREFSSRTWSQGILDRLFGLGDSKHQLILQPLLYPGLCWPMVGTSGYVTVRLSHLVHVESIGIDHLPYAQACPMHSQKECRPAALKDFEVYGFKELSGFKLKGTEPLVTGSYSLGPNTKSLQLFNVRPREAVKYVTLKVNSNHGELRYTCIYRLRVHGRRVDG